MALNRDKELKLYYSIHEVAEQFGVAESLLRFWETEFPQLKPHKAGRNIRQYTKEDLDTLRIIYNLVKVRGLKLAAARKLMQKNPDGENNTTEVIERLKDIREQLSGLNHELNILDKDSEPQLF